jgi:sugar-specific transcriptional regulator TrmB
VEGEHQEGLEKLGLSTNEAKVYLALLERGRLGAPALIEITGVPRGTIYPVLTSLTDRGIVQVGAGYGGRYQALPPGQAVAALMRWEKDALAERERLAGDLAKELEPLAAKSAENPVVEQLEVLRDQRSVAMRFEQMEAEAQREIAVFVKAPFLLTPSRTASNPQELNALRRGIRARAIYEKVLLDSEDIAPHLRTWIEAGEEARVFDGALPHQLAVFDGRAAIVPMTGSDTGSTRLVIRDAMVVAGMLALFNAFWERSRVLRAKDIEPKGKRAVPAQAETH